MNVPVIFQTADGDVVETEGEAGNSLLSLGQKMGMPLEGTCEGQMACSTCHVIVDPDCFDRLPEASEDEEDMLDLAYGVQRTSRLSCQITLDASLEGLKVSIPDDSTDMSRI